MARRRKLPLLENVPIEDIGAEGKAVARVDGIVVFVKEAVPGDVADLQVFRKKGRYMEARVVRYHSYSDQRTKPFCEHFGICGGCKWQHLPYDRQLHYKQQQVEDAFRHIGGVSIGEVLPILPSDPVVRYRNKLEYTFSNHRWLLKDELEPGEQPVHTNAVGLHVPGRFDKVVDISTCHLQEEPTNAVRNFARDHALEKGLSFYDHRTNEGLLRNLIIRTTTTGEVMVILSVQFDVPEIYEMLEALQKRFPDLTSLMYVVNPKKNETLYDQDIKLFAGRDHLIENMEGLLFRIGPKSFFQTNSFQALELYRKARELAELKGDETLYDLYTGTGTIALFMARHAGRVVGIESVPEAVEDARRNAQLNEIGNARFFAGDMKEIFTGGFIAENGKPDVIITDPPRAGMHEKVVRQILDIGAARIVYVSCNPATQARDIDWLSGSYRVSRIQPVDMFPHTHHVENIALLEHR